MLKNILYSFSNVVSSLQLSLLKRVLVFKKIPSADTVYDEYLSHYGHSMEIKQEFITELELILNHIYYKKAQGEDYVSLLLFLRGYVSHPSSQTTLAQEIQFLEQYKGRNSKFEVVVLDHSRYCLPFQVYLQQQKQIVDEYDLPYSIKNSAIAFLNMQDSTYAKRTLTGETDLTMFDQEKVERIYHCLEHFEWNSVDILLAHSECNEGDSPQGYYDHVGIYSQQDACIIEAVDVGVRKSTWKYWAENFSDFSILRFETLTDEQKCTIEDYALSKIGEAFSLTTHKVNEQSGWYCSKFVYLAYLAVGIDLDIKHGVTIFPDDIVMGFQGGTVFCPTCGK